MKRRCLQRRSMVSLAGLLCLSLLLLIFTFADSRQRADAANGQKGFALFCSACHGINAQGDGPQHTLFIPPPANLTLIHDSPAMIGSIVRHGIRGTQMPAFGPVASDKVIREIVSFLASQPPDTFIQWATPWGVNNTPQPTGIAPTLFVTSCMGCHGATGNGDGPWAANDAHIWPKPANFHARNSDIGRDYYIITNGREGTMMPPHLQNIPAQARWELAGYVAGMYEPNSTATISRGDLDLYHNKYAPDNKVAVQKGHRIYNLYCSGCHGVEAQGSFLAPPHIDRIWYYGGGSDNAVFSVVSKGVPGNLMPSFASLSVTDRWDVITYLRWRGGLPDPLSGHKAKH